MFIENLFVESMFAEHPFVENLFIDNLFVENVVSRMNPSDSGTGQPIHETDGVGDIYGVQNIKDKIVLILNQCK